MKETEKHIKPIFLLGYMGSGKTTMGQQLACATARPFVDTDEWLAKREGMPVGSLMRVRGEASFRQSETEILHQLTDSQAIVATGGGMPCFADNMDFMNACGRTIYLKWTVENLAIRLEMTDIAERPLLCGKTSAELRELIATQLREREPIYAQAQYTITCNGLDEDEVLKLLMEKI